MRQPTKTIPSTAIALIFLGIGLTTLGSSRYDGFVSGMFQGAGVALILFGVFVLGSHMRSPRDGDGTWLPSRDGDA